VGYGCLQSDDGVGRELVDLLGGGIRQVMRKVGADEDQGFRSAPEDIEHFAHFLRGGITHHQRQQLELRQQDLQKRQLHFQRVLLCMGVPAHSHLRQADDLPRRGRIDFYRAQRRVKHLSVRQRQTAESHPVRRTEQHHAADLPADRNEQRIGTGGHRTGVNVAGMRCNQRLGTQRRRIGCA